MVNMERYITLLQLSSSWWRFPISECRILPLATFIYLEHLLYTFTFCKAVEDRKVIEASIAWSLSRLVIHLSSPQVLEQHTYYLAFQVWRGDDRTGQWMSRKSFIAALSAFVSRMLRGYACFLGCSLATLSGWKQLFWERESPWQYVG